MSTINGSHQGKSQMENVAVKKGAFLLKQHCQQLKKSKTKCLLVNHSLSADRDIHTEEPYGEQFLRFLN